MNPVTRIIKTALLLICIKNVFCEEKIIIIGAGASGMAAATRLLENGIENILVLEAEPRIGGRINTVVMDGKKIDIGAQWCHGQKGNIVYEKLEELNLLNQLFDDTAGPVKFYISSRTPINEEFSEEFLNITSDMLNKHFETSKENVGEALENRYTKVMAEKYGNNQDKLNFTRIALGNFRRSVLSLGSFFDWYDAALDGEYESAEGNQGLGWKNGYGTLFDLLTKKIPNPKNQLQMDDKILLNKEVVKINYNKEDAGNTPIKIECSDKSSYTAKHVIVTPSLGVLKERAESLFEPQLSQPKTKAIESLGIGAVLKVFASFETKWWGNYSNLLFVWTEEDAAASRNKFPFGPKNQKGESWIVEMYESYPILDSNIMSFWFVGDIVPLIETMDENVLIDGIHYACNLFMGHLYNITKPVKLLRSNWYHNPHFHGTYSYLSINATGDDNRALQSPIKNLKGEPLVQFAGEATNPKHYATVQGAVESGYREADRLIKLYKKDVQK